MDGFLVNRGLRQDLGFIVAAYNVCHNVSTRNKRRSDMPTLTQLQARCATAVVGFLLVLPAGSPGTTEICKEVRLKPLHCVCGTVLNVLGEPVANATLTVLSNGNGSTVVKTSERGEFSFDELTPGNYELQVQANGFRRYQFPIVVVKSKSKCSRALEIRLTIGYPENCTGIRIVKR
jgi:hypothetical protein